MTTAIKVEPAKHSAELASALEKALGGHDLRIRAGLGVSEVLDTLTANKVSAEARHGNLCLTMNGQACHVPDVIEALARERSELFYPREVKAVKSRDELDSRGKVQFIRENGFEAWQALPQSASKEVIVTLDPARMTREQWMSLPVKQRAELSSKWSTEQIGKVLARKVK